MVNAYFCVTPEVTIEARPTPRLGVNINMLHDPVTHTSAHHERERLLRMLTVATFMIFFQAYMVAPIIPKLSALSGSRRKRSAWWYRPT